MSSSILKCEKYHALSVCTQIFPWNLLTDVQQVRISKICSNRTWGNKQNTYICMLIDWKWQGNQFSP